MKRGIRKLCSGTDGDSRFIKQQKYLVNFGDFEPFGSITLAGSLEAEDQAMQDSEHILKKMKNIVFEPAETLRMGDKNATLGHLVILTKKFDKNLHNLNPSDLDPTDKMNYK